MSLSKDGANTSTRRKMRKRASQAQCDAYEYCSLLVDNPESRSKEDTVPSKLNFVNLRRCQELVSRAGWRSAKTSTTDASSSGYAHHILQKFGVSAACCAYARAERDVGGYALHRL